MNKRINTKKFEGEIQIHKSKSHVIRSLYGSLLVKGQTKIFVRQTDLLNDDIKVTLNILIKLNCIINYEENFILVNSINASYEGQALYVHESATTLRVGIPILLYLYKDIILEGTKKLLNRPMDFLENIFERSGIYYKNDGNYIYVRGNIEEVFKNDLDIKNCSSSQFITGLMYIAPIICNKFTFNFIDEMQSVSYLLVTKDILNQFGIDYSFEFEGDILKKVIYEKGTFLEGLEINVSIDYSSIAFWLVANKLGANITFVENIYSNKYLHPDKSIIQILDNKDEIIDLKDSPDLFPILCIWASFTKYGKKIINFQRNRIKESNRVEDYIMQLNKIGANIKVQEEFVSINPIKEFKFGNLSSNNDHRIAMSLAIATIKSRDGFNLDNLECVNKSYPKFWQDYEKLGGKVHD